MKLKISIIHEETQRKSQRGSGSIYVIKFYVNLHKFSFDFLGLDNIDFENYFANELIKMGRFFKPFKTLAVRALSDI